MGREKEINTGICTGKVVGPQGVEVCEALGWAHSSPDSHDVAPRAAASLTVTSNKAQGTRFPGKEGVL